MEKQRWEESEKRKSREKVEKSRFTVLFQWFVAPEGRNAKAAGRCCGAKAHFEVKMCKTPHVRTTFGSWDVEALWREAHFEVKMCKAHHSRSIFGSWDVQKVHAVAGVQHIWKSKTTKHTSGSEHFWKLRRSKSARRCGAKHMSKSTCTKHTMWGPQDS